MANMIAGVSQISGAAIVFFSGLVADRIGPRRAALGFVATTGLMDVLLGTIHGPTLTPVLVFLQAASTVCCFPAGFALAAYNLPPHLRSSGLSLVIIIGMLSGWGVVPTGSAYLAEIYSFSLGFACLGILTLGLLPLIARLGSLEDRGR